LTSLVCEQIIVLPHSLTITTSGISLSWFGYIKHPSSRFETTGTYSIDGEPPINFTLSGLPPGPGSTSTLSNQKFFQIDQLSPTSHKLQVQYAGSDSKTPLTLDYLIIQNGTSSSTTTPTSSLPTSTSSYPTSTSSLPTSTSSLPGPTSTEITVSATSSPNGSVRVGPIVGGVIGGLALLVFAILGLLFLLRRRHERNVSSSTPWPFDYTPLHLSSTILNTSSGGFSNSQLPQTSQFGSLVTYRVKGQTSHSSMPSVTSTDSTEPPSPPSGAIAYPTNLHVAPLVPLRRQRTASNLANSASSSSSSPLASLLSTSVQLEPLPHIVEREAEALAPLRPQRGNPSVLVSSRLSYANVVLHVDSGVRIPSNFTSTGTSVVDVPPLYTPD
jgi:hypothetical protein